jgi:hypothetical protein
MFIKKRVSRIGKHAENYHVSFKPLVLTIQVSQPIELYLLFERGP